MREGSLSEKLIQFYSLFSTFQPSLLPSIHPRTQQPTHRLQSYGLKLEIVLFKLNCQKDCLVEMFVKRKYLLPGFVSEKRFLFLFVERIPTVSLIRHPQ